MLVLTRKLMERLYIGDDICITVVRVEGGQVRLGIDAPRHIRVVRGELLDPRQEPEAPRVAEPPISRSRLDPRGNGSRHPAPSR
jgi:carbon storage regulator